MSSRSLHAPSLQTPRLSGPTAEAGLTLAGAFAVLAEPNFEKHQPHGDDQPGSDQQEPDELNGPPTERRGAHHPGDDQKRGGAVESDAGAPGHG